ncbi:MAG: SPOR domain-containing protein [Spirochaetales bacterium]|nr:SPOR domain-containing protein [Spirochaetales bacterium]
MMDISKKAIMIISAILLLSVSAVINISAESIWEGSAAMGRYGELPMSGYYGASNSFAQNAYVEVENLDSGKRTRLIVVDRLSNSGLLMLVSNEAAEELGIYRNDIVRIKVRLLSSARNDRAIEYDDLAYNPDPDMNPAASLVSPEELAYNKISSTRNIAAIEMLEADEPVVVKAEPVETAEVVETESPVIVLQPPVTDELPGTTEEIPEKPFGWPDSIIVETETETEPEPEPEPEPLYLGMDNLDEGMSVEESVAPVAELELLSSGLAEAKPVSVAESRFSTETLPEVVGKIREEGEYITEITDYHSPEMKDQHIADEDLPSPLPNISVEVIAALVGDSTHIADAFPETEGLESSYLEAPDVVKSEETEDSRLQPDLAEAVPLSDDTANLVSTALPELPGVSDKFPVDVADGYVSPEDEVFETDIADFPDYTESTESSEMTEVAETAETVSAAESYTEEGPVLEDEPPSDDIKPVVPEYDENLELTLEPAESRPPELVEEDIVIVEAEPLAAEVDAHAGQALEAAASREPTRVFPVSVPDRVVMADKLEQKRHYLQLGAFRERNSALRAAGKLENGYPVTILTDGGGEAVSYKLLLGPLSEDESGALLYNFRAGGYSDAFIRRIE